MIAGEDFTIEMKIPHRVRFSREVFSPSNDLLQGLLETNGSAKVICFAEKAVLEAQPHLKEQVEGKVASLNGFEFRGLVSLRGAENAKKDLSVVQEAWDALEQAGIDRHSYIFCIGGGAFLDAIGLAAATAHRGVRFVRFPTTTLSQDDSGVGVKNGINAYGKKNFIGTFSVPYAVVNDFSFLETQPESVKRTGLIEAIKVALVKDGAFFEWIEDNILALSTCKAFALEEAVERSALLHADHIARGGDPFENGNSRPLDYGHWAAHKLEQLTDFRLSHAEAVSIGLALDTLYAVKQEWLTEEEGDRVFQVLDGMGFPIWDQGFDLRGSTGRRLLFSGLEEFREHLGGELTILMLCSLGGGMDVHEVSEEVMEECIEELRRRALAVQNSLS